MKSSSDTINIAAVSQRLDVDNRISIRYYYRIADNILKQADIFRAEKNIIDLYVMLLRFSSLVSETIPCHRDYKASPQSKKVALKKKLLNSLNELEELKPLVQQKIIELNRRQTYQQNRWGKSHSNNLIQFSPVKKQTNTSSGQIKVIFFLQAERPISGDFSYRGSRGQQFSYVRPVQEHFHRLSLTLPRPKEETLSRHSILGPNGLKGQWQPPTSDKGIRYPTNIDLSPVEIPSLQQSLDDGSLDKKDNSILDHSRSDVESIIPESEDCKAQHAEEPISLISFETTEVPVQTDIIRQPSPPPVLAEVQDLIPAVSPHVAEAECKIETPSSDELVHGETPLQLHISTTLMENFMKLAKSNTDKNLETCGILAGLLKNRKFYITTLIIPKQESTSDTCQTTNEEEIFEVQDKLSLFPLGWIHTHPTQSCFMSSVDLHTHYSYQIMLPESVAIVMAPRDSSRKHGIFRLTAPGGMSVIRQCQQRGFHHHSQPPDGGPLYNTCTDVYINPDLNFDVIDLR
ncbi:AMSH-like ubiquitin thioesterase 1 [Senna tora]|uniref:AMSH-like ubiquitin thioesterase 1 n=1 Tax=Senna tora TaxID=362788 RepID=A0A834WK66_9FABA|nr:AMSH-like ubiquitin thioesterase 1 [Senna tora]